VVVISYDSIFFYSIPVCEVRSVPKQKYHIRVKKKMYNLFFLINLRLKPTKRMYTVNAKEIFLIAFYESTVNI
jgi:hypothetical protein